MPLWGELQVGGREHSLQTTGAGVGCNEGICGETFRGAVYHRHPELELPVQIAGLAVRTCYSVSVVLRVQFRLAHAYQLPSDYRKSAALFSLGFLLFLYLCYLLFV